MDRVVLKFGGSSLGDTKNLLSGFQRIYRLLKEHIKGGEFPIIISSALMGRTRELKNWGYQVGLKENTKELDSLLAIGEEESCSLLSGYLNKKTDLRTELFLRNSLPIKTNNDHGQAKIIEVDTQKIEQCIDQGVIPIIPGFIGYYEGNSTTLGLDGSDTTAVAVAKYLKVKHAKFYKDVLGVYTGNPRRIKKAKKIPKLSFEEMKIYAQLGSKIFHPNGIKWAEGEDFDLEICSYFSKEKGSIISKVSSGEKILGVTYFQEKETSIIVSLVGDGIDEEKESQKIVDLLSKNYIMSKPVSTGIKKSASVKIIWLEQLDTVLSLIHHEYGLDETNGERNTFIGEGKESYDPGLSFLDYPS